jgi:hypothetical protein
MTDSPAFPSSWKDLAARISTANSDASFRNIVAALREADPPQEAPWLQPYYLGLCFILHSLQAHGDARRDSLLLQAEAQLSPLLQSHAEEAEVHIAYGFLLQAKIMVSVWTRGPLLIGEVERALGKALKLDPNNPRAHFLMGQTQLHKPALLGGGARKALPSLQRAAALFEQEGARPLPYPNWGADQNGALLATLMP